MDDDDEDIDNFFFDSLTVLLILVAVEVVIRCNCLLSSFVSEICGDDGNGNTCFEVEGVHLGG